MSKNEKLFWYWINERHQIYINRFIMKDKAPWTKDKILQTYKFTNVFRQLDRVTIELNKFMKTYRTIPGILLMQICVFRMFNWPLTYEYLQKKGYNQGLRDQRRRIIHNLIQRRRAGNKNFTGAYIITNQGLKDPKEKLCIDALCKIERALFSPKKGELSLYERIKKENTMQGCVEILTEFPMIGKFVGYEIACDLRYTKILNRANDVNSWANAGPGAKRGLNRIHGRDLKKKVSDLQYLEEMRELLMEAKLGNTLEGHVPDLEMREIEHSLCEFDKYMRVKKGEGRPRSLFRPFSHKKWDSKRMKFV